MYFSFLFYFYFENFLLFIFSVTHSIYLVTMNSSMLRMIQGKRGKSEIKEFHLQLADCITIYVKLKRLYVGMVECVLFS